MKDDPAIQEIRDVRHEISARCGHDLDRFFAFMKKDEKRFQKQINRFHRLNEQYVKGSQPVGVKSRRRQSPRQSACAPTSALKAA
ncbi:MAG: hypothetical protein ABSG04_06735 [Verrucomicrobiota bacterium]|jgi:hypothetical protein